MVVSFWLVTICSVIRTEPVGFAKTLPMERWSGTRKISLAKAASRLPTACSIASLKNRARFALAEASPEGWQEHGRFRLAPQTSLRKPKGKIWTHPVIANGRLYLRDQNYIYCYDVSAN